jgi:hypothetical protein
MVNNDHYQEDAKKQASAKLQAYKERQQKRNSIRQNPKLDQFMKVNKTDEEIRQVLPKLPDHHDVDYEDAMNNVKGSI